MNEETHIIIMCVISQGHLAYSILLINLAKYVTDERNLTHGT